MAALGVLLLLALAPWLEDFLAELFECGLDPFQVIKWKELYQLVEDAIDSCDDVACVVHRIALKNV